MLIDRKIERYVRDVAKYVPARDRVRMNRELTDLIHEMVYDYAGSETPDILDCKDVLRDLGTPEEVAKAYLESKKSRIEERSHYSSDMAIDWMQLIYHAMSVIGTILVIVGVIGIGTNQIDTMLPMFLGVVLALISVMGRSVLTSVLHVLPHHDD